MLHISPSAVVQRDNDCKDRELFRVQQKMEVTRIDWYIYTYIT